MTVIWLQQTEFGKLFLYIFLQSLTIEDSLSVFNLSLIKNPALTSSVCYHKDTPKGKM
jgi:hypothetical protein